MKDNERNTIGMSNSNPILDTRVYEVYYTYGYRQALAFNVVAGNLIYQVDK